MKRSLGMPHTHIHMTHRNLSHAYQVSQATPLQKENGLVTLQIVTSLASQIHFHKRGKGLVNCVYKLCSTILYSVVQSRCSILSHDTLHHCLSSNASFQNGDRELEYLFRYCRNCKNISTILLRQRAYSTTGNSRVDYLKSGYVIQLVAFRWDTACIRSSPDPSISRGSGSGLRDQLTSTKHIVKVQSKKSTYLIGQASMTTT